MQELKTQSVYLEDGRRADKLVQEEVNAVTGEAKIVTELWAEPKIDKKLTQRVVDYKRPVVYKREVESVDEATGQVLERRVESIDPEVRRELREHIQTQESVSAMSAEDCNCYVTQEDMQKTFTEGFLTVAKMMKEMNESDSDYIEPKSNHQVSTLQAMAAEKYEVANTWMTKLGSMGMVLWGAIAILLAIFLYVVFLL